MKAHSTSQRFRRKIGFIPALGVLFSSLSVASSESGIEIDALIELVLSDNPDVRIAQTQTEQAEARLDGARWKYIPKVTSSISYFTQEQNQINNANNNPGIPTVGLGGQTGWTAKVGTSFNVFNGFQDRHRQLQRRRELEKASLDVEATRLSQFDKAISSIHTILRLQSDRENIEEKLAIEKERARDIRHKVSGQLTKKSDLLSIEASLLASESDLQGTLSDLKAEWQKLRSLTNKELPFDHIRAPLEELAILPRFENVDLFPDLRSSALDAEASKLSAKVADGARLPSVDVSFNQYFLRPEIQKNNRWDVQATITIPLPFDGEKKASLREADAVTLQKEAALLKKRREKTVELENLVASYNSGIERHRTLSNAVQIQAELVDALRRDYQHGLASISDYLTAVSTLIQKKQERDHLFIEELQRAYQIKRYQRASGEKP